MPEGRFYQRNLGDFPRIRRLLTLLAIALVLGGCSVRKLATSALAETLLDFGAIFASDDDPELIASALPFALKTIEGLLADSPEHAGLLLAACQGFTQYGFAFVEVEAERWAFDDYTRAETLRIRARGLYRRGRDYCFRALDGIDAGALSRLREHPEQALGPAFDDDVDVVFWTGAAWGAVIAMSLDQPEMVVDLPAVRALVECALAIDADYQAGLAQEAMMALEALPQAMGGSVDRARQHFDRAVALAGGDRAGTYVTWARSVAVAEQDRETFVTMLEQALAVDLDALPAERLANRIAQRRARTLLDQIDDLFI